MIQKVLIANRGEIAVRIFRALRDMGLSSVAVYSEADRAARHVRLADEAYCIGPPPSAQSYLNMDAILDAARRSGAHAIHPGYGFLSENAAFARRCEAEGLVFIGPPASAIHAMGEKTRARQLMAEAGVPVIPGTLEPLKSPEEAAEEADRTGYPVMLKAAAGGGGKGMRLVHEPGQIAAAFRDAASEALKSFGDGSVYLERAVVKPRHIEMQILADTHGNCVYLGERECSIQRRHQKVVEEAPSPIVSPEMRAAMGEVAVRAAKAVGYVNAGTIEFLVDQSGEFFFMEMNTRLQVEHAVTEMVTGIDLVREQIRIADGEPMSFRQEDVQIRGWSMECRILRRGPPQQLHALPGQDRSRASAGGSQRAGRFGGLHARRDQHVLRSDGGQGHHLGQRPRSLRGHHEQGPHGIPDRRDQDQPRLPPGHRQPPRVSLRGARHGVHLAPLHRRQHARVHARHGRRHRRRHFRLRGLAQDRRRLRSRAVPAQRLAARPQGGRVTCAS